MIIIMVMVRIGLQHSALAPIMAPATSPLRRSPAQRPRFSRSTESPLTIHDYLSLGMNRSPAQCPRAN